MEDEASNSSMLTAAIQAEGDKDSFLPISALELDRPRFTAPRSMNFISEQNGTAAMMKLFLPLRSHRTQRKRQGKNTLTAAVTANALPVQWPMSPFRPSIREA